jgi:hydrogenase-4 component E
VSGGLGWAVVLLGVLVVVTRRRSVAVGIVTAQALVVAFVALLDARGGDDAVAAGALAVRGVALAALFLSVVMRTREMRPLRAGTGPVVRGALAIGLALALIWLVPVIGLESRNVERAVLALVAFGAITVATRRATLFQVLGVVLVENGLALAAVSLPGGASLAIELGVALDLILIGAVATIFHTLIFAEFGAGDTAALESLRD